MVREVDGRADALAGAGHVVAQAAGETRAAAMPHETDCKKNAREAGCHARSTEDMDIKAPSQSSRPAEVTLSPYRICLWSCLQQTKVLLSLRGAKVLALSV